ncbi:uncharacterized protein BCR38DRAFT_59232 [Pseudomassariella vexata]|uniref:Uncharacterized protein n=1 Tax=Pseudomassariella vexata TaxID=1141098 RepID=A0A1Y2DK56_9PEZI|nr:uncharacterized protein BCR38DRAFT_59232 [Pseudomassariella vexata]ORY59559.1 hypothetical protein BCR38DRAFT_59232 [Pseudomassariella vexata]
MVASTYLVDCDSPRIKNSGGSSTPTDSSQDTGSSEREHCGNNAQKDDPRRNNRAAGESRDHEDDDSQPEDGSSGGYQQLDTNPRVELSLPQAQSIWVQCHPVPSLRDKSMDDDGFPKRHVKSENRSKEPGRPVAHMRQRCRAGFDSKEICTVQVQKHLHCGYKTPNPPNLDPEHGIAASIEVKLISSRWSKNQNRYVGRVVADFPPTRRECSLLR